MQFTVAAGLYSNFTAITAMAMDPPRNRVFVMDGNRIKMLNLGTRTVSLVSVLFCCNLSYIPDHAQHLRLTFSTTEL